MRTVVPVVAAALLLAGTSLRSQQSAPADLASVLRDAANYLEQYERDVVAVTAREDYRQTVGERERPPRSLVSEFLILADPSGWVEFRDVFEVDGQRVRDRDERLMRLFKASAVEGKLEGRRIAEESARFNAMPTGIRFNRTLNVPMTALRYLQRQNQSRSSFEAGRVETRDGRPAIRLRFREGSTMAPLIASNENARAEGTFWIEPQVGRVLATELSFVGPSLKASIKVGFAEQTPARLWLPSVMEEAYQVRVVQIVMSVKGTPQQSLDWLPIGGRATYTNYRQFTVSTDVKSEDFQ